ncbi:uncharacterized protein J7T54_003140 [Emericellopsis cladophorae]|uniref:NAD(P)-binding domain-containing protein n=1 Tax=Emericellopsis cladophorae TaxID=2686198 RepID=A0A9P9Y0L6_9HYPO|nr:uncharacterized protein J7T54_003140 [Emericellopsis cladophorae]KAI6780998.1 hypothetical protein J7T54_003140 [Emericellopsis cladophorae]
MPSTTIFGATGLTGSHILGQILAAPTSPLHPVTTITRRAPKSTNDALTATVEEDTSKWASLAASSAPEVVISALGTTRAAAGGVKNQWKIDHDLNIEIARKAKEAGAKTFVFMSSAGTRGPGSAYMPYCQMKNGVEDAIKELDFEHAVIVKPGTILGPREHTRTAEGLWQKVVGGLGHVAPGAKNALGQDADVIARATIRAIEAAVRGEAKEKFWVVDSNEILSLGKQDPAAKPAEDVKQ